MRSSKVNRYRSALIKLLIAIEDLCEQYNIIIPCDCGGSSVCSVCALDKAVEELSELVKEPKGV
jgi:ferredoxin